MRERPRVAARGGTPEKTVMIRSRLLRTSDFNNLEGSLPVFSNTNAKEHGDRSSDVD